MRIALVHDWLTRLRGGERVLDALCELYPDAELFTLLHVRGSQPARVERSTIHSSFIQYLPAARRAYRHYLPLFPAAVEMLDLDRFDLVVSTSHCAAKSVIRAGRARHLCYCLTPMRYAWDQLPRVLRCRTDWAGAGTADAAGDGGHGPLGRGHLGTRRSIRRDLAIHRGADREIL